MMPGAVPLHPVPPISQALASFCSLHPSSHLRDLRVLPLLGQLMCQLKNLPLDICTKTYEIPKSNILLVNRKLSDRSRKSLQITHATYI
jgi:hypothetical protein